MTAPKLYRCPRGHSWLGENDFTLDFLDKGRKVYSSKPLCAQCIFELLESFFGGVTSDVLDTEVSLDRP